MISNATPKAQTLQPLNQNFKARIRENIDYARKTQQEATLSMHNPMRKQTLEMRHMSTQEATKRINKKTQFCIK